MKYIYNSQKSITDIKTFQKEIYEKDWHLVDRREKHMGRMKAMWAEREKSEKKDEINIVQLTKKY